MSALDAAAKVRARFRSEEFKSGAFGELQDVFATAVRTLAESGDAEKSLAISEAGRARALLDQVRGRVKQSAAATVFSDPLGQPVTLAELREYLQPRDAIVEYHVTDERTIAWVVRPKSIDVFVLPVSREQLRHSVTDLRARVIRFDAGIKEYTRGLYDLLVRPLGLKTDERIVLIPHDELHLVPFQALHDGDRYLIEGAVISTAPSASVLVGIMKRRGSSTPPQLIAFGNPDLGSPEFALPGAEREVKNLEKVFTGAKVYVGAHATKGKFVSESPQFSLIHVAAHAVFDDVDPLYSRIRLAADQGIHGTVLAHEIYRLNLSRAALITLSSCESGVARITRGDEVWGFPRSFLSAGASTLLLSLWPVADESTELLMTSFYQSLGKMEAREALREAQLQLLKHPKFGHPFFWSAFTLTGDWR
jgi:CHAT domain-containing protein